MPEKRNWVHIGRIDRPEAFESGFLVRETKDSIYIEDPETQEEIWLDKSVFEIKRTVRKHITQKRT